MLQVSAKCRVHLRQSQRWVLLRDFFRCRSLVKGGSDGVERHTGAPIRQTPSVPTWIGTGSDSMTAFMASSIRAWVVLVGPQEVARAESAVDIARF
jgi:hypothetical protein